VASLKNTCASLLQKFKQLQGSPRSLARGTAVGVFIGIAPLMPFKSLLILLITVPTRSSTVAAFLVGTLICNPLTYIPLYYLSWLVGDLLLPGQARWENLETVIGRMQGTGFVEMLSLAGRLGIDTAGVLLIGGLAVALPLSFVSYSPALRFFSRMERKRYQNHLLNAKDKERIHEPF
jgi:uncharacterized protein (DUF2062 family)